MVQKTKVSKAFSIEGWNFMEWLKGNVTTIKEIVKVGVPLIVSWYATGNPYLTALITLGGKLLLDTIDYFVLPHEYKV